MSSKKSPPYIIKPSANNNEVGIGNGIPPRYQPPPLPNNNNNNHTTNTTTNTTLSAQTGVIKNPPPKDAPASQKLHYPPQKGPDPLLNNKLPYNPNYPPNLPQPGNKYNFAPFPPTIISRPPSEDNRVVHQAQIHQAQIHQDPRLRPFDEPGIPHVVQDPRVRQPVRYGEEEFPLRPEMLKFVRKPPEDPRMIPDQNRQFQNILIELRNLKEANQRLADDNQELRDLCCFLDDDRQKGRKLAREWQRFGRYTASVMRQEVSAYQSKLRELDNKQQELIKDNLELKELCLYLDEERGSNFVCSTCGTARSTNVRDDGDGSSSSTNADEPAVPQQFANGTNPPPRRSASRERLLHENLARQRSTFNDQIMQYVRNLESKVKQLEEDKRALTHKINDIAASTGDPSLAVPTGESGNGVLSGRPEAVVRALQVLEVREQLERDGAQHGSTDRSNVPDNVATQDMDDGEKALVREMCNVVWRKLEEAPPTRR